MTNNGWFDDSHDKRYDGTTQVAYLRSEREYDIGEIYKAPEGKAWHSLRCPNSLCGDLRKTGIYGWPVLEVEAVNILSNDEESFLSEGMRLIRVIDDNQEFIQAVNEASLIVPKETPIMGLKGVRRNHRGLYNTPYRVGNEYSENGIIAYEKNGIHYSLLLDGVSHFYGMDHGDVPERNRLLEVAGWGMVSLHRHNVVCSDMRVIREIGPDEIAVIKEEEDRGEYRYRQRDLLFSLNMEHAIRQTKRVRKEA